MTLELILGGLVTLAGGGFFGVLATGWFQHKKVGSEAVLNTSKADLSTAEFIKVWANELKADNDVMRAELSEFRIKFTDTLIANKELLARISHLELLLEIRDKKIKELTNQLK